MTTAFIIRMHYEVDDPRFEWRFEYFKKSVLPRIRAQSDEPWKAVKPFEIAIRCNPEHAERIGKLDPMIRTFQVQNESARYKIGTNGQKYFIDFVPWSDVIGLPRYDLQLGLDSDDLITYDYLETVMKTLEQQDLTKVIHISFQPKLYELKTGKMHDMSQRYNSRKGSAFFALYQPRHVERYRFAYELSHLRMWTIADKSITIPAGHCFATCHDINESTHV